MKQLLITLCLALTFTIGASAQEETEFNDINANAFVFKIGGGLASHYGSSAKNIGAFQIGIGYDYRLGGPWSVEPALLYYAKGWKNKDREVNYYDNKGNLVYDDNGNIRKGVMNVTSNTNYIELPILIHFNIPESLDRKFTLSAGPYFAYGIGGKTKYKGDTEQTGAARYYYDHNSFDQEDMHRFDFGITTAIDYHFMNAFSAGIATDWGLANVNKDGKKNISISLVLAYRLR